MIDQEVDHLAEDIEKAAKAEETAQSEATEERNPLEELQSQHDELKNKYLRLMAEFENYKKRTARERMDLIGSASQDLMSRLLPVLDDFERARKLGADDNSEEVFPKGVELVYNKLNSILEQKGLTKMETVEEFNPEHHEAITKIPAPTPDLKGKIIDVIEHGYLLNDRIIRHAKVVIGE